MRAAEAWDELQTAMTETPPKCAGDLAFTLDHLTADELAECAAICATCPLLELCNRYATTARVTGGFWAGRMRTGAAQ